MREGGVDLLLLDLVMPGLDGFGVLAAKAADPALRAIPVVVLSARDPEREPVSTPWLAVSRQGGLLSRDLLGAIRALVQALPPRFGAAATLSRPREQRETRAPSKAFG